MAKKLFEILDDKACIIFDATYILTQKSKDYSGQKQLWSDQKKMPLVKPMIGCTDDGYIAFASGPFDATHNDASILEYCFTEYYDKLNVIHSGDTILVDRGFRDVQNFLKCEGLFVYSPGTGNLETKEENDSRFVTKCRM